MCPSAGSGSSGRTRPGRDRRADQRPLVHPDGPVPRCPPPPRRRERRTPRLGPKRHSIGDQPAPSAQPGVRDRAAPARTPFATDSAVHRRGHRSPRTARRPLRSSTARRHCKNRALSSTCSNALFLGTCFDIGRPEHLVLETRSRPLFFALDRSLPGAPPHTIIWPAECGARDVRWAGAARGVSARRRAVAPPGSRRAPTSLRAIAIASFSNPPRPPTLGGGPAPRRIRSRRIPRDRCAV